MAKILYKLALALLIATATYGATPNKKKQKKEIPVSVNFPEQNIPLPIKDFSIVLPPAPEILKIHPPQRKVSETFSLREKSYIAIKDPQLFKNSNTEIIDLSIIPEGAYAFPLPNGKVISPYGGRRKGHSGTDIKTCPNDTIVAAFDGVVRMAKPFAAYGNVIVIRHFNGLETVYSHNSKNLVQSGDYVKAGDPIGLTGRTGRATTEHLHFETRINGEHFNPNIIFDMEQRTLKRKNIICMKRGNTVNVKTSDVLPHQLAKAYKKTTK